MSYDQRALPSASFNSQSQEHEHDEPFRDIHALTPPRARAPRREAWETSSHRSSSLSVASTDGENFTSISREFNALVLAGSTIGNPGTEHEASPTNIGAHNNNLIRIGEDETLEETNPLAIVPDNNPRLENLDPSSSAGGVIGVNRSQSHNQNEISVQMVKKEEIESKINAWQNAKVAKINNRFKREDAVINGWEGEQVQKATSWMKKVERKLEEKRAKALEKMQNDIAKARRKAEERRASAEAKRGTKVARILEIANLMRAVGRAPAKRSFF